MHVRALRTRSRAPPLTACGRALLPRLAQCRAQQAARLLVLPGPQADARLRGTQPRLGRAGAPGGVGWMDGLVSGRLVPVCDFWWWVE
jgi:hypothetical protein